MAKKLPPVPQVGPVVRRTLYAATIAGAVACGGTPNVPSRIGATPYEEPSRIGPPEEEDIRIGAEEEPEPYDEDIRIGAEEVPVDETEETEETGVNDSIRIGPPPPPEKKPIRIGPPKRPR
jgi:hypothetical protein